MIWRKSDLPADLNHPSIHYNYFPFETSSKHLNLLWSFINLIRLTFILTPLLVLLRESWLRQSQSEYEERLTTRREYVVFRNNEKGSSSSKTHVMLLMQLLSYVFSVWYRVYTCLLYCCDFQNFGLQTTNILVRRWCNRAMSHASLLSTRSREMVSKKQPVLPIQRLGVVWKMRRWLLFQWE